MRETDRRATFRWDGTDGAPARILLAHGAPLRGLPSRSVDARPCTKAGLLGGTSLIALAALSLSFAGPAQAGLLRSAAEQPRRQNYLHRRPAEPVQPSIHAENGDDTINLDSGIANAGIQGISGGGGRDTFNLNGATVNGTLFGGESSTDIVGNRIPGSTTQSRRYFQSERRDHQRSGLRRCSGSGTRR